MCYGSFLHISNTVLPRILVKFIHQRFVCSSNSVAQTNKKYRRLPRYLLVCRTHKRKHRSGKFWKVQWMPNVQAPFKHRDCVHLFFSIECLIYEKKKCIALSFKTSFIREHCCAKKSVFGTDGWNVAYKLESDGEVLVVQTG